MRLIDLLFDIVLHVVLEDFLKLSFNDLQQPVNATETSPFTATKPRTCETTSTGEDRQKISIPDKKCA